MNRGTKQAFQYAVPKTIPVLIGYLFLGAAYGILMQVNGFGIGWTAISSIFIYAGSLLTFNTQGLDFALTALFVVIFTDQWKHQNNHRPALIGLLGSAACVVIFGASSFIIPAMVVIILALTWGYKREKKAEGGVR